MANHVTHACSDVHARIHSQDTLCAINNLPAEILAYIFQLAVAPSAFEGSYETPPPSDASHRSTLHVASTCSHWRAISLNNPFMWSCFDTQTPTNYLELAMRRNQSVPLSILGPLPVVAPPDLFRILEEHLHRVRTLELSAPGDAIQQLFGVPATSLDKLTCYVSDFEDHDELPLALPAPDAPNLRDITLYQCTLDLVQSPRVYEKLTNILIRLNETTVLDGFCERLLSLCRASPNLQDLYVITPSMLPIGFNLLTPPGSERIRLAGLRAFRLQMPIEPTLDILASLSLPPGPLDFTIGHHRLEADKDVHARLWTREHLPATLFTHLQEITITFHLSHAIALRGVETVGSVQPGAGIYIGFDLEYPDPETGIIHNSLAPVASYMIDNPMPNLRHLAVLQLLYHQTPPASETRQHHVAEIGASLHRLLSSFPTLTSLTLRFGSSGILKGLRSHLRESGAANASLLPSLEKCTIQVGHGINVATILGFVRLLLPNQIGELHLEGTQFNVKSHHEALEFVQEKLPRLAREVWVTGSSVSLPRSPLRHSVLGYWQRAEACPLRSGDPESVPRV